MALADPDEATVTHITARDNVTVTSLDGVTSAGDVGGPLGSITLALRLVPLSEDELEQVSRWRSSGIACVHR